MAFAQGATAWTSSQVTSLPGESRVIELSDGGLAVLRHQAQDSYQLERLGPDLQSRWRVFFTMPDPPDGLDAPTLNTLFEPSPLFSLTPHQLLSSGGTRRFEVLEHELRILNAGDGAAVAYRFDLETGTQQREVLVDTGNPKAQLRVLSEGTRVAVVSGLSTDPTRWAYLFDGALHRVGEHAYTDGGRDRRLTLDARGRLCRLREDNRHSLTLARLDADTGAWHEVVIEKGLQKVAGARLVPDPDGGAYIVALLEPSERVGAHLLVARVGPDGQQPEVVTRTSLGRMMTGLRPYDPRWLVLQGVDVGPDGNLLLHGQFVIPQIDRQIYTEHDPLTGFDSYSLRSRVSLVFWYREIVAFSFGPDGALRWSTELAVSQQSEAASMDQIATLIDATGYVGVVRGDRLRVQYVDRRAPSVFTGADAHRVVYQDILLEDGRPTAPVPLMELSPEEGYVRALTCPLADDTFLITVRLRPGLLLSETTLSARVDPARGPALPTPIPAGRPHSRSAGDYVTGRLVGFRDGLTGVETTAAAYGLSVGAGSSAAVMAGAWVLMGATPWGCCAATLFGCGGCAVGVGVALGTGGAPRTSPWGDWPADFQLGYRDGYRLARRRHQARWAAIGGAAAVSAAVALSTSGVMFEVLDTSAPPPGR